MSRRSTKARKSARRWKERYAVRDALLQEERAKNAPQRILFDRMRPEELVERWEAEGLLTFQQAWGRIHRRRRE